MMAGAAAKHLHMTLHGRVALENWDGRLPLWEGGGEGMAGALVGDGLGGAATKLVLAMVLVWRIAIAPAEGMRGGATCARTYASACIESCTWCLAGPHWRCRGMIQYN